MNFCAYEILKILCRDRILDGEKVHVKKQLRGMQPPESPVTLGDSDFSPSAKGSRPGWQKPNLVLFQGIESKPQRQFTSIKIAFV
jgi:hypothetical protein